jgi:hypothetical protein
MLGLEIAQLPTILPTHTLPEGVLGSYAADRNLIRVVPSIEKQATSVLAHELAHAWSFQGGFGAAMFDESIVLHPKVFIEGFAQWVESKVLDYFGFQFEIDQIANWIPDAYGVGFRLFANLEEDPRIGGVGGVVRFVQEPDRAWLAAYLTGPFQTEIGNLGKLVEFPPDWEPPTQSGPIPTAQPETSPSSPTNGPEPEEVKPMPEPVSQEREAQVSESESEPMDEEPAAALSEVCAGCGEALPADARFCAECGTPVATHGESTNGQQAAAVDDSLPSGHTKGVSVETPAPAPVPASGPDLTVRPRTRRSQRR